MLCWIDKERFKKILKDKGITQEKIAYKLLMGKRSSVKSEMSDYVNGKLAPQSILKEIADYLNIRIEEFCNCFKEADVRTYNLQEIYDFYQPLVEGHVVSIVSSDGLLEAHDDDIFKTMVKLAKRKVQIRYYYPDDSENPSLRDYKTLIERYREQLSLSTFQNFISGYQIEQRKKEVFGWNTRYVVISRWNQDRTAQEVQFVFLFVEGSKGTKQGEESTKPARVWIPLHEQSATKYFSALAQSAEPVHNLGLYQNRLESIIQQAYRTSFDFGPNVQAYKEMRSLAGTSDIIAQVLNETISKWSTDDGKQKLPTVIRILDVGGGDGAITEEILGILRDRFGPEQVVRATVIEPSHIPKHMMSKCLIDPSTSTLVIEKSFEDDLQVDGQRFDLVLSVHSMYLIDPSYLRKMYSLMNDGGIMAVISAPQQDNVFNLICTIVDKYLPKTDNRVVALQPYPGKVITEDSFRNYAEDLHHLAKQYFHNESLVEMKFPLRLDTSIFITREPKLTPLCMDVVKLFSYNWLSDANLRKIEKNVVNRISQLDNNGTVPNDNWAFIVSKDDIRHYLGNVVNGELLDPGS